jgi:hypothetical protein
MVYAFLLLRCRATVNLNTSHYSSCLIYFLQNRSSVPSVQAGNHVEAMLQSNRTNFKREQFEQVRYGVDKLYPPLCIWDPISQRDCECWRHCTERLKWAHIVYRLANIVCSILSFLVQQSILDPQRTKSQYTEIIATSGGIVHSRKYSSSWASISLINSYIMMKKYSMMLFGAVLRVWRIIWVWIGDR